MSKPKSLYDNQSTREQWYAAGLVDGEKRLERNIRRWLREFDGCSFETWEINDWLKARAKKEKKNKS